MLPQERTTTIDPKGLIGFHVLYGLRDGVAIDLIVRGMCRLRPGVAGLSEKIGVVSIIDRYLEHARVFYFHNGAPPCFSLHPPIGCSVTSTGVLKSGFLC
jgi:hypothetical protein